MNSRPGRLRWSRSWLITAVGLALAFGGVAARAQTKNPSVANPLAPHVFLNAADFERINALACAEPWAGKVRSGLVQFAEEWPAQHVREYGLKEWAPPPEGGGWGGDYICPDDGASLEFSPGHNRCPRCGKEYSGWPTDYVIYSRRHVANARAVHDLALAFRLTGRTEFATKARAVLLTYATLYPTLPIRDHKTWPKPGGPSGGRVTPQTLNESDWVRVMAVGYELIRETLAPAEREQIERDILRNGSDVVAKRSRSLGNWTARHNAAHLAVGLVLGDRALIDLALNAEFGFRDELNRGISAEGQWREGSWGYHFYVMDPLFAMREMVARAGIAVPEVERLRGMLDAPLAGMLPDLTMPNFNDSGFTSLRAYARYYDIGFRVFGDRRYLGIVRGSERGLESLLWGAPALGGGELPVLASTVLREAGLATLRAPGSDFTIALKFGEHGGGHGHFDKLNFVSYALGRMQAVDPGSQSYAYKTHHTWDQVTLAHNTVVVDETTQAGATGRLLEWHPGAIATAIRVEAGPVYPNVTCQRLLVHTARYALDVFAVTANDGASHRFDWIYHNDGKVDSSLALKGPVELPTKSGYEHLSNTRATGTAGDWEATFTQGKGGGMRLFMLGERDTQVVLGEGLGQDLTVPVPFAMARRRGTEARFIAVYEPVRGVSQVRSVRLVRPGVVRVESIDGTDEIGIVPGQFKFTRAAEPAARE